MAENARVLLIDSDEVLSKYLREKLIIDGGYLVSSELSAQGALEIFRRNPFEVVIVKFEIPDLDCARLIKELKKIDIDCVIIVLVSEVTPRFLKETALLGVYDFITEPINLERLFFLIKKGSELHYLTVTHRRLVNNLQEHNVSLQKQNILLAKRIEESTKNLSRLYEDLRSTYMRTIKALAQAIDARDHYTHSHSENVARYSVIIAEEMGLSTKDIEMIRDACELHDLGKIGVEDSILVKPDTGLTTQEWEQIRRHPEIGGQILEPLIFLEGVIDLIRQHHENYDGSGYPRGLKGDAILLGARVIRLADTYDSMRSARAYRKIPFSKEDTIAEIKVSSGREFDPKVVEAFLKVVERL